MIDVEVDVDDLASEKLLDCPEEELEICEVEIVVDDVTKEEEVEETLCCTEEVTELLPYVELPETLLVEEADVVVMIVVELPVEIVVTAVFEKLDVLLEAVVDDA